VKVNDVLPLESRGIFMMEEEEQDQREESFTQEDEPIQIPSAHLQMVLDKIIAKVSKKYELRLRPKPSSFTR
jgi:hypothetical protein